MIGFTEAYREVYPDPIKYRGGTTIDTDGNVGGRIDYIYYKGREMKALEAEIITQHPSGVQKFPSDHCAVTAVLRLPPEK